MKKKSKFGIIVLLDALGARNMTIEMSQNYLLTVDHLRKEIHDALRITLDLDKKEKKGAERLFNNLRPRFFADSLLMTYEVIRERQINNYLDRISFILNILIVQALEEGILYRGAISIGHYIENENIVLGPAVTDAANWYDRWNMIGVTATPATSHYIKAARNTSLEDVKKGVDTDEDMVLYDVPVTGAEPQQTYTLNWPKMIQDVHADIQRTDPLLWYYQRIKGLSVPLGSEPKYANTERFVLAMISDRKKTNQNYEDKPSNKTPQRTAKRRH
jgi:hypothetical protein